MIPYYSPNIRFWEIIKILFVPNQEQKIIDFFQKETQKKFVLITSSCRTALYLTYQALPHKGNIITTPLSCESAIDPIFWSKNKALFLDVSANTLNADFDNFDVASEKNIIAVQVVNHGCVENNIDNIRKKYGNNVFIVEDCALSFGNKDGINNRNYQSDVVCFSFLKNSFGLGGGILATNSEFIYENAKKNQSKFPKTPLFIVMFRFIYGFFETIQSSFIGTLFFSSLKALKPKKNNKSEEVAFIKHMKQPHLLLINFFGIRISKMQNLIETRKKRALLFIRKLKEAEILKNYFEVPECSISFGKIFLYNPLISSQKDIQKLNALGIHAKHLEQRDDARIQIRYDLNNRYKDSFLSTIKYDNYKKIHDSIISLPLNENMKEQEMDEIINQIKTIMNENSLV